MADNKAQALAAIRRSARSAERRLNATEAEMRFASDIAAGIYTTDMIPAAMNADKIMELSDFYIVERAFEANVIQSDVINKPAEKSNLTVPPSASLHFKQGSAAALSTRNRRRRIPVWVPAVCILTLFAGLCVYSFYINSLSLDVPDDTPAVEDRAVSSAVDYKTSYVGSTNSNVIHRSTCRHVDSILEENKIYYKNIADALADGRAKCSICLDDSSQTSTGNVTITDMSTGATWNSSGLVSIAPPKNGKILKDTRKEKLAPLTIKTSGSQDYFVSLKCIDTAEARSSTDDFSQRYIKKAYDMTFFVEGGNTAEILVPLAEYEICYATGDTWYGAAQRFGEDTKYYRCGDTFLFDEEWDDEGMHYSGWTLTLYSVPSGNMETEEISAEEFLS